VIRLRGLRSLASLAALSVAAPLVAAEIMLRDPDTGAFVLLFESPR